MILTPPKAWTKLGFIGRITSKRVRQPTVTHAKASGAASPSVVELPNATPYVWYSINSLIHYNNPSIHEIRHNEKLVKRETFPKAAGVG